MNHHPFKEQLFMLYDGQLSGPEAQEVTSHLEACSECRKDLSDWQQIAKAFFNKPDVRSSPQFVRRVMNQIGVSENFPRKQFPSPIRWLVPALGAGLMILLFAFALSIFQTPQVSIDTLLLTNGRDAAASEWAFQEETPEAQDLLVLILEEP